MRVTRRRSLLNRSLATATRPCRRPSAAAAAPMEVDEAVAPSIDVDLTAEGVAQLQVSELRAALEAARANI